MRRPVLRVWIPTNRAYDSKSRWGQPKGMDGLNELIAQNRTNRNFGAAKERENVMWCARFVRQAMRVAGYAPMTEADRCKCHVLITVVEAHDRRDIPNVYGGVFKYACDALTARNKYGGGAIWDDSSRWMVLTPKIRIDPTNPGIEITVITLEETNETQ